MEDGLTIYKTVWHDGPNGEERDVPVAFIPSKEFSGSSKFVIMPVLNLRGRAYAFRNDHKFRKKQRIA